MSKNYRAICVLVGFLVSACSAPQTPLVQQSPSAQSPVSTASPIEKAETQAQKSTASATSLKASGEEINICPMVGEEHRTKVAFETKTYFVSVCKLGQGGYLYIGREKANPGISIQRPARPSEGGYRANNSNTVYAVELGPEMQWELKVYQNDDLVLREPAIGKVYSSKQPEAKLPQTGKTVVACQTPSSYAHIYQNSKDLLMDVTNRQDGVMWMRNTPVKEEPSSEGYTYTSLRGELSATIFQSRNGRDCSIQIGDKPVEYGQ